MFGESYHNPLHAEKHQPGNWNGYKYGQMGFYIDVMVFRSLHQPNFLCLVSEALPIVLSSPSTMISKAGSIVALLLATTCSGLVKANPINLHYARDPGYKPASGGGHTNGYEMEKAKAVYFMTNLDSNTVVALPVADDGSVSAGTMTLTGGAGGNLVDAMKGTPNGPDALGSQGSVQVEKNVSHKLDSQPCLGWNSADIM